MLFRGETMRCETMTLAGWLGADFGDQSAEGKCRSGYVIGLMASTSGGPCHILQWAPKFSRKGVKRSLCGEECAFSEMVDHMSALREFRAHPAVASPGLVPT